MTHVIIKGKDSQHKLGKTRSEQEQNIRKEWGPTMNDGQLDRLKYAERKFKERTGSSKNFIKGHDIDLVR